MRKSYVQIDGQLYEKGSDEHMDALAPLIMPDIAEYTSMITGERITSRSRHREHLREHGMVELGNDSSVMNAKPKPIPSPDRAQLHEILRAQVNAMTHEQWKAAGRRDLERLRWQTRGIPDPLKEI